MKNVLFLLLLLPLFLTSGCGGGSAGSAGGPRPGGEDRRSVAETGTVKYLNLEGGFYGIVGDSGEKFLPQNLSAEFRQDGLRVTFEGTVRNDVPTIYMWGTPVEITSVRAADPPG